MLWYGHPHRIAGHQLHDALQTTHFSLAPDPHREPHVDQRPDPVQILARVNERDGKQRAAIVAPGSHPIAAVAMLSAGESVDVRWVWQFVHAAWAEPRTGE
jgi:hypothetical protein